MALTFSGARRRLYERSPTGYVLGYALVLSIMGGAILTENSYLQASLVARNGRLLVLAGVAFALWLAVRSWRIRSRPGANDLPPFTLGTFIVALLFFSAVFAGGSVLMLDIGLLMAVKYGPSKTVEFRSQVDRVSTSSKGCRRTIHFGNPPLTREADFCAANPPLDHLKVGDRIVVQERMGSLGGTVVAVKEVPPASAPPAATGQKAQLYQRAADFCAREGKKFRFIADVPRAAGASETDVTGEFRFRCE